MKKIFLLFILLCPALRPVFSQEISQTIRGAVKDEMGEYIEGATVVIYTGENKTAGTFTDSLGRYRFDNITTGRYNLAANMLGYEPAMIPNIVVSSGKQTIVDLTLTEAFIKTEAVVINAGDKTEARNEMVTVSARQFSIEETMRYAGSWNDPSRMASNFAGVANEDDSRNDIIIRGNSPTGLLWRLEGVDIPNPNHFGAFGTTGGPVSILNNNLLDNSDFMTGAWPSEYGNALGGVFDLRLRKGNDEKSEFLGQLGFNGLEFLAEGPISRSRHSSFLVSYRYSTLELFHLLGIRFGTSAQPHYQDLTFKLNFPSRKLGDFSLFGIGGLSKVAVLESERDTADFFGPSGNDIWFGTNMGAVGVNHFKALGEKTWLRSTVALSAAELSTIVDRVDRSDWSSTPFYRNSSAQAKGTVAVHLNHKFNPRHTLRGGFFANQQRFNLQDSVQLDTAMGWLKLTGFKGGAWLLQPYLSYKFRITEKLTLNAGMHFEWFTFNQTSAVEPRAGLRWDFAKKQSLGFAFGSHSQLQPMYFYFAEELQADSTYLRPNEDLDMTRSLHAVIAWDFVPAKNLRLKAELFYQHLYNVPVNVGDSGVYSVLNEGADYYFVIPDSLDNAGTGRNYGAELTVEKFFSRNYYFLFTGTLYESRYTGGDGVERNTRFNGKFTLHLLGGAQYYLGAKKRVIAGFDGRITWAGGKFYTPLDEAASQTLLSPVYQDERAYTVQYPDYIRLDLRGKVRLNSKKLSQEWAVDVTNVLNRKNVLNQAYDLPSNSLKYNYQLGLFPVAQYRIEF